MIVFASTVTSGFRNNTDIMITNMITATSASIAGSIYCEELACLKIYLIVFYFFFGCFFAHSLCLYLTELMPPRIKDMLVISSEVLSFSSIDS